MSDARHPQLGEVVLGEGRQVGALDLVLLEAGAVLAQVDALQPVPHVVLVPQVQGLLVEGSEGQQRRAQTGGVRGRRRRRAGARAGAGAPHHEADLLGLLGEAEAGRLEDGLRRRGGGRRREPEAGEAAQGVAPVGGPRARARGAAGDGVAAAGADGVRGAVTSLRNGVELT